MGDDWLPTSRGRHSLGRLCTSLAKGPLPYLLGKLRRVGHPFAVWSVVHAAVIGNAAALLHVWRAPSYLWYLLFLLAYYVFAMALVRVPRLPLAAA